MSVRRYRIDHLPHAVLDMEERMSWIVRTHGSPQGAADWRRHVDAAVLSLDTFPARREAELPPPGRSLRPVYILGVKRDFIVYEVFENLGIVRIIAVRSMVRRLMDVTDRLNFEPPV